MPIFGTYEFVSFIDQIAKRTSSSRLVETFYQFLSIFCYHTPFLNVCPWLDFRVRVGEEGGKMLRRVGVARKKARIIRYCFESPFR